MKTFKKLFIPFLLIAILALGGCSKSSEAPDLGATVAGTYKVINFTINGVTLPISSTPGAYLALNFTKKTTTSALVTYTSVSPGQLTTTSTLGTFNLADAGNGIINFIDPSATITNIGSYTNGYIYISTLTDTNQSVTIRATRQ